MMALLAHVHYYCCLRNSITTTTFCEPETMCLILSIYQNVKTLRNTQPFFLSDNQTHVGHRKCYILEENRNMLQLENVFGKKATLFLVIVKLKTKSYTFHIPFSRHRRVCLPSEMGPCLWPWWQHLWKHVQTEMRVRKDLFLSFSFCIFNFNGCPIFS